MLFNFSALDKPTKCYVVNPSEICARFAHLEGLRLDGIPLHPQFIGNRGIGSKFILA